MSEKLPEYLTSDNTKPKDRVTKRARRGLTLKQKIIQRKVEANKKQISQLAMKVLSNRIIAQTDDLTIKWAYHYLSIYYKNNLVFIAKHPASNDEEIFGFVPGDWVNNLQRMREHEIEDNQKRQRERLLSSVCAFWGFEKDGINIDDSYLEEIGSSLETMKSSISR